MRLVLGQHADPQDVAVDQGGHEAFDLFTVAAHADAQGGAFLAAHGEELDLCLVGEPTNPEALGDMIKIGRRGSLNGTLVVDGTQGHVAYPALADNPVRRIVGIMSAIMASPLDNGSAHFDPSNLEFTSVDVGNSTSNVIPSVLARNLAPPPEDADSSGVPSE